MAEILILNGSPRAPRSNSKQYAELFSEQCRAQTKYLAVGRDNHAKLCGALEDCTDLLLVSPLYADGIPVPLLRALKAFEEKPPKRRPTVSVLINCGFYESEQNDVAVDMVRQFCRQAGFPFGSALEIGSGEAILGTPFRGSVRRKIKKLARAIETGKHCNLRVTMPIPRGMFVKASTKYWIQYGAKNGVTAEQMATMQIEDGAQDEA